MGNPIQPQFKIRIFTDKNLEPQKVRTLQKTNYKADTGYLDIEEFVEYNVVYEEQDNLLNTLHFKVVKYADILLYYFHIGQAIEFYGGTYSEDSSGMKYIFSGSVTRIKTSFLQTGDVVFNVECINYGYNKLGKEYKHFVYGNKNARLKSGDTYTLQQIIEGIAKDNNVELGMIDLSSDAKKVRFDKVNIKYQKNVTDWKFLTMLAQDFGCCVWMSTEENDGKKKEVLNFVSQQKAVSMQSDITFVFPLRGQVTSAKESEIIYNKDSQYNRIRMLTEATIDEDISTAACVNRSACYFDKNTGDFVESVSRVYEDKDGKRYMAFYEFDEQKVAEIEKTQPEIAKKIRDGSPTDLEWGDPTNPQPYMACYYYKISKIYDETQAVFDKAFFGISVNAKCNQDLNIHSHRTYKIRGVLSYFSKNLETSFFLRGLKHIWDSSGTWTELEFLR